jgi:hypothetical protein
MQARMSAKGMAAAICDVRFTPIADIHYHCCREDEDLANRDLTLWRL